MRLFLRFFLLRLLKVTGLMRFMEFFKTCEIFWDSRVFLDMRFFWIYWTSVRDFSRWFNPRKLYYNFLDLVFLNAQKNSNRD